MDWDSCEKRFPRFGGKSLNHPEHKCIQTVYQQSKSKIRFKRLSIYYAIVHIFVLKDIHVLPVHKKALTFSLA